MNRIQTTFVIGAAALATIGLLALQGSQARAHCPADSRARCAEGEPPRAERASAERANRSYRYYGEGLGYWLVNQPSSVPGAY